MKKNLNQEKIGQTIYLDRELKKELRELREWLIENGHATKPKYVTEEELKILKLSGKWSGEKSYKEILRKE
jgi:hypothetical protein